MRINFKMVILVLVIFAIGFIFAIPYIKPAPDKTGRSEQGGIKKEYAVTPRPAEKLQEAKGKNRPVFLEFSSGK